jgi:hypothetical protein
MEDYHLGAYQMHISVLEAQSSVSVEFLHRVAEAPDAHVEIHLPPKHRSSL